MTTLFRSVKSLEVITQFSFTLRLMFIEKPVAVQMRPFLAIAFVLVFLCRSEASLSNAHVGNCRWLELFCDMRKCITLFIKGLQSDPKGDCRIKFNSTISCVRRSYQICLEDEYLDHFDSVRPQFTEFSMCSEGSLGIPTSLSLEALSYHCTDLFSVALNACLNSFHEKFAIDKADPSLCTEHARATQCSRKLIATDCTIKSQAVQDLYDLTFINNNYNPYCANNRDPGATGNEDQCFGVEDLDNPWTKLLKNNATNTINNNSKNVHNNFNITVDDTSNNTVNGNSLDKPPKHALTNEAAGIRISVFLALPFPFVSLLTL